MCGWFSADAARASRRNRSSATAVAGDVLRQKLQGDESAQASVFGLVDDTHPAAAEFRNDAIAGNTLTEHSGRERIAKLEVRGQTFKATDWGLRREDVTC